MSKSKKKKNTPRKYSNLRISRKKGMNRLLDPKSTGLVLSNMLNSKSLHNLSRTSKKNIGVLTESQLKKRKKEYLDKKAIENKLNSIQFVNNIESGNGGDYMYELNEYFYEWKYNRDMEVNNDVEMENDEDFEKIEREFIMSFFYPRSRYSVKYVVVCPSLTNNEINSINVDNLKSIITKCLGNLESQYYKLDDEHYSLDGGFNEITKTKFKSTFKF